MTGAETRRPFYGWYVVGMSFIANFISVGTGFYLFNVFMKPMCEANGWTSTEANLAPMIATLTGLVNQVLYGTLVMKYGPRLLMPLGAVFAGTAFAAMGWADELWKFYLLYVLLFLGNGAYGAIVASTAVNNWFVNKRGSALGLATVGVSLSGFVLPGIFLKLMNSRGMSEAFLLTGVAMVCVAPLFWLVVRNRPEDHGLHPDGMSLDEEIRSLDEDLTDRRPLGEIEETGALIIAAPAHSLWRLDQVARTGAFWQVGFAYGFVMIGVVGVMSQLKVRFTSVGYEDELATMLMGATALLGAFGKYFWGSLCDRFDERRVVAVLFGGGAIGLSLIFWSSSIWVTLLFVLIFGFSMGGVMSTFPILIASLYGRYSFASVARFVGVFLALQAFGYLISGMSADHTGSYNFAYAIYIGLDIAAFLLILFVKRPKMVEGEKW
jgi:MFS transporter, OFA family, oxalate/formate antiporter